MTMEIIALPFPVRPCIATIESMSCTHPIAPFIANAHARDQGVAAWQEACAVWPTLAPLKMTYPGFSSWYWSKVVPGILRGTRAILRQGSLNAPSGLAIVKRDVTENKICTLWVSEEGRGRGLGRELLEEAIDWIGDDHPLFTVSAQRYEEFQPLMKRFRFNETQRLNSLYRPGVVEHIYNGQLSAQLQS
ncbi:GNAT superfamily N-acetyltransferase [Sphingobium sp. B2D3A]|nr:GNAT superfamily N-acetyltransferase [Sphingobium sp. B2D3A]